MVQWLRICLPMQRIFTTQGLNLGLPHCRQILYRLSSLGSPPPHKPSPYTSGLSWIHTCGGHCDRTPRATFQGWDSCFPSSQLSRKLTFNDWLMAGRAKAWPHCLNSRWLWPSRLPSSDLRATWDYITVHLLLSTNPLKRILRRHGLPTHFLHINLHIRVCFLGEQIKSRAFPEALLTWLLIPCPALTHTPVSSIFLPLIMLSVIISHVCVFFPTMSGPAWRKIMSWSSLQSWQFKLLPWTSEFWSHFSKFYWNGAVPEKMLGQGKGSQGGKSRLWEDGFGARSHCLNKCPWISSIRRCTFFFKWSALTAFGLFSVLSLSRVLPLKYLALDTYICGANSGSIINNMIFSFGSYPTPLCSQLLCIFVPPHRPVT